jgi:hypothetical protein
MNPTREDLNGTMEYKLLSFKEEVCIFLAELRLKRHDLVAVTLTPNGDYIVFYHVKPPHKTSSYMFNVHELVTEIKKLGDLAQRHGTMVPYQLEKMSPPALLHREKLAEHLDPKEPSYHVISCPEMAAILLRAYWLGYENGKHDAEPPRPQMGMPV